MSEKFTCLVRKKIRWIIGNNGIDLPCNQVFHRVAIIDCPRAHRQVIAMTMGNDCLIQKRVVNTQLHTAKLQRSISRR